MEIRDALSAHFLTLTYEKAPTVWNWNLYYAMTLKKEDVQKFFKRLRMEIMGEDVKWLKKSDKGNYSPRFRYFACGEY